MNRIKIFFTAVALSIQLTFGWVHLELGAGNYGLRPMDKVFRKIEVSPIPESIKIPQNLDKGIYNNPKIQYYPMLRTLHILVARHGADGIIYLNDFIGEDLLFAKNCLDEYIREWNETHPDKQINVEVRMLLGDYYELCKIKLPCEHQIFDSIHIKNPEVTFFSANLTKDSSDRDSLKKQQRSNNMMRQWANRSRSGLYLFVLNMDGFMPLTALKYGLDKGVYTVSRDWPKIPYMFPQGLKYDTNRCLVLHVKPSKKLPSFE